MASFKGHPIQQIWTTKLGVLFLFWVLSAGALLGQSRDRDALKVGYAQFYLAQESQFKPGAYLEYSRLFYAPVSLAVHASFTQAKNIVTTEEIRDLLSISLGMHLHYAVLETDQNQFNLILGFSARLFETQRLAIDTGDTRTDNFLRPGLAIGLNYDYLFDPIFVGLRGMLGTYSKNGAVYWLGAHVGFRF